MQIWDAGAAASLSFAGAFLRLFLSFETELPCRRGCHANQIKLIHRNCPYCLLLSRQCRWGEPFGRRWHCAPREQLRCWVFRARFLLRDARPISAARGGEPYRHGREYLGSPSIPEEYSVSTTAIHTLLMPSEAHQFIIMNIHYQVHPFEFLIALSMFKHPTSDSESLKDPFNRWRRYSRRMCAGKLSAVGMGVARSSS